MIETCKRTLTEKEVACICAGTLRGVLHFHPLSLYSIMLPPFPPTHIVLGLRYLHHHFEQPIIHKDIKSANILLTEQGEVKLGTLMQLLSSL